MRRRLLIADDEPDIRAVVALSLRSLAGWDVLEASSGLEAVEVAGREQPDAILLDVSMPGLDGPATAKRLADSEHTRDIPVLFLTASVPADAALRTSSPAVRGVLAKPFDPLALCGQATRALGWTS